MRLSSLQFPTILRVRTHGLGFRMFVSFEADKQRMLAAVNCPRAYYDPVIRKRPQK